MDFISVVLSERFRRKCVHASDFEAVSFHVISCVDYQLILIRSMPGHLAMIEHHSLLLRLVQIHKSTEWQIDPVRYDDQGNMADKHGGTFI